MKNVRAFIIGVTVLVGIAGCSTPDPKSASGHQSEVTTAAKIEDARLFYEAGHIDAAEQILQSVLAIEPNNRKAHYYLSVVQETRVKNQKRQSSRKDWLYYPTYPPKPIYHEKKQPLSEL